MTISPKTALIFLSSIAGAFFVVFIALALSQANLEALSQDPLVILNVDAEVSIPTWFAQSLFLTATFLLFLIGKAAKKDKKFWYILAGIMLFVSIDEGASIHELLIVPVRELLQISEGPFYYAWVIVYGLVFAVAGLFFVRFFARLPRRTQWLFGGAAALFLAGAIGMEMIGGFAISTGASQLQYAFIVGIEELLEMLGASLFIYALLDYVTRSKNLSHVAIEISSKR